MGGLFLQDSAVHADGHKTLDGGHRITLRLAIDPDPASGDKEAGLSETMARLLTDKSVESHVQNRIEVRHNDARPDPLRQAWA
ncbi:hypothetical protein RE428_13580 [Marinobacter nanhaiticus D15-8W]|nr:hypothetical protein RE428_13580 [Marinobacter nanhaiticus D15-8W]